MGNLSAHAEGFSTATTNDVLSVEAGLAGLAGLSEASDLRGNTSPSGDSLLEGNPAGDTEFFAPNHQSWDRILAELQTLIAIEEPALGHLQPTEASAPISNLAINDLLEVSALSNAELTRQPTVNQTEKDISGAVAEAGEVEANETEADDIEAGEPEADDVEADEIESELPTEGELDGELGILRVRSQDVLLDDELGLIRIQEIEQLPVEQLPQPPTPNLGFVSGRASFLGGSNLFRLNDPIDDRVFQVGTGFFLVPKIARNTDLVFGVEGNLVRYSKFPSVNYNELQLQAGIRQRITERVYGQLTWRNQNLYVPNEGSFFSADFIELLLSRRDILTSNIWLDTYYQARVSFSHPDQFSRFSQLGIASLNYGFTPQFRTTLIYQLFLDDYTQINRFDTYHQVIGQITYDVTPRSRINLFGGVKFGESTDSSVNFDEVVYGASFNFNVPIF